MRGKLALLIAGAAAAFSAMVIGLSVAAMSGGEGTTGRTRYDGQGALPELADVARQENSASEGSTSSPALPVASTRGVQGDEPRASSELGASRSPDAWRYDDDDDDHRYDDDDDHRHDDDDDHRYDDNHRR